MSIHTVTLQEQLAVVDRLLIDETKSGSQRSDALRAIAADLRVRVEGRPTLAARELQKRLNIVKQSKSEIGYYSDGTLIALAQELIGRWPTVRLALERFDDEVSK